MAICPHCETKGSKPYVPCPSGDGYFLIDDDASRSQRDDPWLGRRLDGRFIVTSLLGKGSMSRVYEAYQGQVERTVAIKLLEVDKIAAGEETRGPDDRDRFIREARVLAKLAHPNCVTLYDFGYDDAGEYLYIAMEHVAGISLRRAVRRGMKFEALVEVVRQVLEALREAHALNIVHRDLKPENIILSYRQTSDEQIVKVLDFGIAKLLGSNSVEKTRAGLLFGTPAYMSPEQCRGDTSITPASDIYSLGCIVFELLTGHLPFDAERPRELVRQHQYEPVPPMMIRRGIDPPEGLQEFVETCLSKEPGDRYPDAAAALAAFEDVVGGTARSGRLASGLANIDGDSRRVAVPDSRISGNQLDPTGEWEQPQVLVEAQSVTEGGGGAPERSQSSATDAPGPGSTETMRDVNTSSGSGADSSWASRLSGRAGIVAAAVVVVALFCALVFAFIYLMMVP